MKLEDAYFQAMLTRDYRFDGKFYFGVKTTGIYCRPICPAKPKRENVEFFKGRLEAERAGYRPCLRCRPESAPQSPAWIGTSAIVQRAMRALHNPDTVAFNEEKFAAVFGVTPRHLRRLFVEEVGKTPKQISIESRLNLARKLIAETSLSMAEIAFASGFNSIRRFNDAFKDRFKRSPSEIRRRSASSSSGLRISVPYRLPFDFDGLLKFYQRHRVGQLEWFSEGKMHRVIAFGKEVGTIALSNEEKASKVHVEIDFPDTSKIHLIISRVRGLLDLDSDPDVIAECFEEDRKLNALLEKNPGIRLPSGWDPFEVAVSTILGQLVSVDRGRALVAQLIELLGEDSGMTRDGIRIKLFPSPKRIASARLRGLGTTQARKDALVAFSKAIVEKRLSLDSTQDVDQFMRGVLGIHGIGQWTADYMALRVLKHTDAFPSTDLILARAMDVHSRETIDRLSPWRGYAAVLLWTEYAEKLSQSTRRGK